MKYRYSACFNIANLHQRRKPTNMTPAAPPGDSDGEWKHDLFKPITNGPKGKAKEEIVHFPPKRYTQQEKAQVFSFWREKY